jgi:hypothetical protein
VDWASAESACELRTPQSEMADKSSIEKQMIDTTEKCG